MNELVEAIQNFNVNIDSETALKIAKILFWQDIIVNLGAVALLVVGIVVPICLYWRIIRKHNKGG